MGWNRFPILRQPHEGSATINSGEVFYVIYPGLSHHPASSGIAHPWNHPQKTPWDSPKGLPQVTHSLLDWYKSWDCSSKDASHDSCWWITSAAWAQDGRSSETHHGDTTPIKTRVSNISGISPNRTNKRIGYIINQEEATIIQPAFILANCCILRPTSLFRRGGFFIQKKHKKPGVKTSLRFDWFDDVCWRFYPLPSDWYVWLFKGKLLN